jgi:hypothetical protein
VDIGSNRRVALAGAGARALNAGEIAMAAARLNQIVATAAHINPKSLPELNEPPPQPYRELKLKARVDREVFERHAWPVIANQVMSDPSIRGEAIGFIYGLEGKERSLSVYFTEPVEQAT